MANTKTGDPPVATFPKGYSSQVREIAVKAREVILSVMPDAAEKVYPGWKVIQYATGADMKSVFAAISPQRERVNLGLANGVGLPDPEGLLEGTGVGIPYQVGFAGGRGRPRGPRVGARRAASNDERRLIYSRSTT